jgi:3-phosphoshikimate 1-carboxyvinyltransferase
MQQLLASEAEVLDVGAAGTAMRFLTAYYALQPGYRILTGTARMKQRPIAPLVEALRQLGADIEYLEQEGFPPLGIRGQALDGGQVRIRGDLSSQYISALMMIGPTLAKGLEIELTSPLVSSSYVEMTQRMMAHFGVMVEREEGLIRIAPQTYRGGLWEVEADYSSASYWFSLLALAPRPQKLHLQGLKADSLQGDRVILDIFEPLGIRHRFVEGGLDLWSEAVALPKVLHWDCSSCPDLAQTIAATCAGLGIGADLQGLQTLNLKESHRIEALASELGKLGLSMERGQDWLRFEGQKLQATEAVLQTHEDHRMALCLAPLCLVLGRLWLDEVQVVEKSYPQFWEQLAGLVALN